MVEYLKTTILDISISKSAGHVIFVNYVLLTVDKLTQISRFPYLNKNKEINWTKRKTRKNEKNKKRENRVNSTSFSIFGLL